MISKNHLQRKSYNILIVDDDVDVARTLKTLLELRGHHITIVDDGLRCITHCRDRERHYDIVFMDYHMEGLDGAEVAEIVKSGDALHDKKTLIFAYTGDNSQDALTEFKQAGMDGAIIKPVDIASIELLMGRLEQSCLLDSSTISTLRRRSSRSILIFTL